MTAIRIRAATTPPTIGPVLVVLFCMVSVAIKTFYIFKIININSIYKGFLLIVLDEMFLNFLTLDGSLGRKYIDNRVGVRIPVATVLSRKNKK